MIPTLAAFLLLLLIVAIVLFDWGGWGQLIFTLLFIPSFLLPSMWIVIFASTVTFIFLQKDVKTDDK